MTRLRIAAVAMSLAAVLSTGATMAAGDLALFLGQKSFGDPIEAEAPRPSTEILDLTDQFEIGILLSSGKAEWPVRIATDLLVSHASEDGDGFSVSSSSWELGLGVRKFWGNKFRPFVGGGLVVIKFRTDADVPLIGTDDDDLGYGPWVDGGFLWTVRRKLSIGLNGRFSRATTEVNDEGDAGGLHIGFLLGWKI
jgi:hypothetical protein